MKDYLETQNNLPIQLQDSDLERYQFSTNAWMEVVGGKHKGRVPGAGNLSSNLKKSHCGRFFDQSFPSSSRNTAQMPDIENMRRLYRSQEEEMEAKLKRQADEFAEYKRQMEQQRDEERKENDAKFQRLESMLQSRLMPQPPVYYNPPPQYEVQPPQMHPYYHHHTQAPQINQPRTLQNMLQSPPYNSNVTLSQAYLQDLNRPPVATVSLPNTVLTSQPRPNLTEALQDYNNSLGPDLDYDMRNNNGPTNNHMDEYYGRDQ